MAFILFSPGFGMIATDKKYKFNCCGTINKWRARAGAPGDVAFQVWRPTGKKGEYKLMGQNVVKCTYFYVLSIFTSFFEKRSNVFLMCIS